MKGLGLRRNILESSGVFYRFWSPTSHLGLCIGAINANAQGSYLMQHEAT